MRNPWILGVMLFIGGWIVHSVFHYGAAAAHASPQWLLLAVLALGSLGYTNLAQTLGFLWGLGMDVFGISLFGSQAWLMALAGFLSGRCSRQLNAEKVVTQQTLAFLGTAFFWIGLHQIDHFFRWPDKSHFPGAKVVVLEFLFNALAAPVVFWLVRKAARR